MMMVRKRSYCLQKMHHRNRRFNLLWMPLRRLKHLMRLRLQMLLQGTIFRHSARPNRPRSSMIIR